MDGDYPPRDAQAEVYPGVFEDQFIDEQAERERLMAEEGGELRGTHLAGMPNSPEMYDKEMERQEYLRACHGGVPDAPEALPQSPTPFTGMKG